MRKKKNNPSSAEAERQLDISRRAVAYRSLLMPLGVLPSDRRITPAAASADDTHGTRQDAAREAEQAIEGGKPCQPR